MNKQTRAHWLAVIRSWPGGFYPGQYAPEGAAAPAPAPTPDPGPRYVSPMDAGRFGGVDPNFFPRRRRPFGIVVRPEYLLGPARDDLGIVLGLYVLFRKGGL